MHFQHETYNLHIERFHTMLEKFPKVNFIGHAQTWWANIDKNYKDDATNLYPKAKVTPGGITDRYLRDYPNMYGDLSAGSGLNALQRDEDHAREFLRRHQDKLIYGSDCDDLTGTGVACQGAQTIATLHSVGIPAAEVRDPKVAVHDPRVVARKETVPMVHPKYGPRLESQYGTSAGIYAMGLPIRFSEATAGFDQPPPELGEHNQRVYGEILGYDANQIAELRAQGVI